MVDEGISPLTEQELIWQEEIKRELRKEKREYSINILLTLLIAVLLVAGVAAVVWWIFTGAQAWPL